MISSVPSKFHILRRDSDSIIYNPSMWSRCGLIMLCVLPMWLYAEKDLDAVLRAYEGRWVGHFSIHSTASGHTQTFPVEQRYWWEDGVLHAIAVSERNEGLSHTSSRVVVKDGQFFCEVKSGETVTNYWGVWHEDRLIWFSANLQRAQDYQMQESIIELDGVRMLKTEGFDTYIYSEGKAHLVYRGELMFAD